MSDDAIDPEEKITTDLRKEMAHEDNMINQRMTWFSMMHGFLFTSFSLSGKSDLVFVTIPISIVGVLSCVLFIISINAAIKAFNRYQEKYRKKLPAESDVFNPDEMKYGFYAPKYMPYVFLMAWAIIAGYIIFIKYGALSLFCPI